MDLANEVLKMYYNEDENNRSGHIKQAFHVAQHFLIENIGEIELIPTHDRPFQLHKSPIFEKWIKYLDEHRNFEYKDYSFDSIIKNLSTTLGGERERGGGWGYPLKVVFPLVAKFINY